MRLTRRQRLGLGLAALGLLVGLFQVLAGTDPVATVHRDVQACAPDDADLAITRIGWARDLRQARDLARQSGRPLFVIANLGKLDTGRG